MFRGSWLPRLRQSAHFSLRAPESGLADLVLVSVEELLGSPSVVDGLASDSVPIEPAALEPVDSEAFEADSEASSDGSEADLKDLPSLIKSGTRTVALQALRDHLAREMRRSQSSRESAVVSRELRETIRELASLGAAEVDEVDEVAARRVARRAAHGSA